jgi:hypothetical protein
MLGSPSDSMKWVDEMGERLSSPAARKHADQTSQHQGNSLENECFKRCGRRGAFDAPNGS